MCLMHRAGGAWALMLMTLTMCFLLASLVGPRMDRHSKKPLTMF